MSVDFIFASLSAKTKRVEIVFVKVPDQNILGARLRLHHHTWEGEKEGSPVNLVGAWPLYGPSMADSGRYVVSLHSQLLAIFRTTGTLHQTAIVLSWVDRLVRIARAVHEAMPPVLV